MVRSFKLRVEMGETLASIKERVADKTRQTVLSRSVRVKDLRTVGGAHESWRRYDLYGARHRPHGSAPRMRGLMRGHRHGHRHGGVDTNVDTDSTLLDLGITNKDARLELMLADRDFTEERYQACFECKHAVEGLVVRTLKIEKAQTFPSLVDAVASRLQAVCERVWEKLGEDASQRQEMLRKMVRRRIEDLIVREYIERDPNDMNKLRYLA